MGRRQIKQDPIVRSFAERLRQVRLARNMTQAKLGEEAGVPASYISDLEQSKVAPGIDLVARLAEALNSTAIQLLSPLPEQSTGRPSRDVQEEVTVLLRDADPQILAALAALLPLLRELSARRK